MPCHQMLPDSLTFNQPGCVELVYVSFSVSMITLALVVSGHEVNGGYEGDRGRFHSRSNVVTRAIRVLDTQAACYTAVALLCCGDHCISRRQQSFPSLWLAVCGSTHYRGGACGKGERKRRRQADKEVVKSKYGSQGRLGCTVHTAVSSSREERGLAVGM